jgi:glycine cleavage system aminomethyltransferase T
MTSRQTAPRSLQQKMDEHGSALNMLRSAQAGPYVFPIPAEYSNWREEQRAWRETVALMDMSFHMSDLYIEGPEAKQFIASLAVNTFNNFAGNKAKQLVACAPNGYLIGDMICIGLSDTRVNLVGRPTPANWVEYQASLGKYDIRCERDERKVDNARPRTTCRFQIQGPKGWELLEKLNGGRIDQPGFFQMGTLKIAGHTLRSLRHGMGGAPGLEFWGPAELYDEVRNTIIEAGKEFGLRLVGARAYSTTPVDSGWLPCPLPALYAGDENRAFRQWLPAASYEGAASLGGSFVSDRIEDYFCTPWELDYGRVIRFDHEFIGREALQGMQGRPHRKKVSLAFEGADVANVFRSQFAPGQNAKAMEFPTAHYASYPYDAVFDARGNRVGVSTYFSFIAPDNALVSLAVVDAAFAAEGTEVTVLWGEPNGGSNRPTVERHVQMELKARVCRWPFSKLAQANYRPGV